MVPITIFKKTEQGLSQRKGAKPMNAQSQPRRMKTDPGTTFGVYVRERRLEMGLTQRALAELTGLSLDLVRHVEQGGTNLQLNKLQQLLAALGGELQVVNKPPPDPLEWLSNEDNPK